MVGAVVGAVILFTPQCAVEHQALLFDIDRYLESPDTEMCNVLLGMIDAYNQKCDEQIPVLSCG